MNKIDKWYEEGQKKSKINKVPIMNFKSRMEDKSPCENEDTEELKRIVARQREESLYIFEAQVSALKTLAKELEAQAKRIKSISELL